MATESLTIDDDNNNTATAALIKQHYDIERALADRLRSASREERRSLYTALYDELFQRVPHHPQTQRKADPVASAREISRKMNLVGPYLRADCTYLEVGPGDCAFACEVARRVAKVYAVDVSPEISKAQSPPPNFNLIISDGCSIPVPPASVTVAYSNQLMEHLHPDDALAQLQEIYKALAPGSVYICITPNRYSGPHDVSQHFDEVATGFHLKEYSYAELVALFRQIGFSRFTGYFGGKGFYIRCPLALLLFAEKALSWLSFSWRKPLARSMPGRALLGINLVAMKPAS
jgi:SAM-dependent methyltransferase